FAGPARSRPLHQGIQMSDRAGYSGLLGIPVRWRPSAAITTQDPDNSGLGSSKNPDSSQGIPSLDWILQVVCEGIWI
ncbi:hypothetical protein NDU88_004101, partial [Pleurodeles waltl]